MDFSYLLISDQDSDKKRLKKKLKHNNYMSTKYFYRKIT